MDIMAKIKFISYTAIMLYFVSEDSEQCCFRSREWFLWNGFDVGVFIIL